MENKLSLQNENNGLIQLNEFENGMKNVLNLFSLPISDVFVDLSERMKVFKNLSDVLNTIPETTRQNSLYLSKFMASTASGLFDASLNYLWDETILQIRKRVSQYDIDYFFDNAVKGDKRKELKDEGDLVKVSDSDLIRGAKEIGLISDLGFKHLEYINYMRNWASAAHPNNSQITGLQLIGWLETCIKEVITLPMSSVTIHIGKLLSQIKSTTISNEDADEIAVFTVNLTQEQIDNLASGFFGIYTKPEIESQVRQNINKLLPKIWDRVSEEVRYSFGIKYASFTANNNAEEKKLSRQFLQIVSAESYIPDDLKISEINIAIDNLLSAHRGFNNFYNEPTFARQLSRMIGEHMSIPKNIEKKFVQAIVQVFLTNGNGIAVNANDIYKDILSKLNAHQANIAVLSFVDSTISSKLQFPRCKEKFQEMYKIIKPSIVSPPIKEIMEYIENDYKGELSKLMKDKVIENKLESLKVLLK